MPIFKPHNFTKKRSQIKYLFQIKPRTAVPFEWYYKKLRQKWLVKKSKFVWRKKPTLSTNIPLLSLRKSEQQTLFKKLFWNSQNYWEIFNIDLTCWCDTTVDYALKKYDSKNFSSSAAHEQKILDKLFMRDGDKNQRLFAWLWLDVDLRRQQYMSRQIPDISLKDEVKNQLKL